MCESEALPPGINRYRNNVSCLMLDKYGITWADACGDDDRLIAGMDAQTPAEFVDWWGEKYDLTPVTNW